MKNPMKPKAMAAGGAMKPGRPYLVGEQGPELIMPRANGDFHVIPSDVTQMVLPAMKAGMPPMPRSEGGPMYQTKTGQKKFALTPYGPGMAAPLASDEGMLPEMRKRQLQRMAPGVPTISDERGVVDTGQLRGAGSVPYVPDVVPEGNPWRTNSGLMPPMTTAERGAFGEALTAGVNQEMTGAGARPVSRYPGQMFPDAASPGLAPMPFEELQGRVAMRAQALNAQIGEGQIAREAAERAARDQRNATLGFVGGGDATGPARRSSGATPVGRSSMDPDRIAETEARRGNPQLLMRRAEMREGMAADAAREDGSSVVGLDMIEAPGGFLPVARRADGSARMAGSYQQTPGQAAPRAESLKVLEDILRDPNASLADRESARRQYNALSGVKLPSARLPNGKGEAKVRRQFEMDGQIMNAYSDGTFGPATRREEGGDAQQEPAGQPVLVNSAAEYDAIPSGQQYQWNGKTYTKK
jgi:hypothetical protein